MKTALSIAGSDCSGGAGIQADIKTMTMHGVYAMSAVTALTAQNTAGITDIMEVSPAFLKSQIDAVFEDIFPDAVKIGMTASAELVKVIASRLSHYGAKNIVLDPVMAATSGSPLLKKEDAPVLIWELLPIAKVVTPNIPEAEMLSKITIQSREDMELAAEKIGREFSCAVLLKGGHASWGADDFLYENGRKHWFCGKRIDNQNTHGTGCTLSSAIAANLAKGFSLADAVSKAKKYVTGALSAGLDLGKGPGPMNHAFELE